MGAAITFDQIQDRSQTIEGTLAYISAWKQKLRTLFLVKFLLSTLRKMERDFDLKALDKEMAEKVFPLIKNVHEKYQETLPILINLNLPFYSNRDKVKIIHYFEYLEDIVEALEIGLDTKAASKIEELAQTINPSTEIPPWREALEQI